MAETNTAPSVKKYYNYAQQQIDEQAILDKYNAATIAQYNLQKEQNRLAENQFYNQMYNTQRTAMDTIRQANAAAVSSGASRGVQAANELSSLLGLQQESVASATELAQASRQTAQEETAAVLENVLNAYQQAAQERAQLVSQGIESASVDVEREATAASSLQAQTDYNKYLLDLKVNDPNQYYRVVAQNSGATDFTNMSEDQYITNTQQLNQAFSEIVSQMPQYTALDFAVLDFGTKGESKSLQISSNLSNLYVAYGLTAEEAAEDLKNATEQVKKYIKGTRSGTIKGSKANTVVNNVFKSYLQNQLEMRYAQKYLSVNSE